MDGIKEALVQATIALKQKSGGNVVMTGGTEVSRFKQLSIKRAVTLTVESCYCFHCRWVMHRARFRTRVAIRSTCDWILHWGSTFKANGSSTEFVRTAPLSTLSRTETCAHSSPITWTARSHVD